jgi:sugar phosphate permease
MTDEQSYKKLMLYRWVVWGILACAFIIVFFHRLAVGVIREDLVNAFNINSTTFANLGAAYFYPYVLMQIPSGILADSLGARKTVTLGMLLGGAGSILFGFAPNVILAFIGRFLVGLGLSVVFIAILKIQSKWFREDEFATMSGLTIFAGNIGGIIAQTPLAIMVAYLTWRSTFIGMGIITLFIALLCFILVRNTPEQIGLPSISISERQGLKHAGQNRVSLSKGLKSALLNKYTWPPFFLFMGLFASFIAFTGVWGKSYLTAFYGLSSASAPNYIIVNILGLSFGGIIVGKISDKLKKRKLPIILGAAVNVISWGLLVFPGTGTITAGVLYPLFFIMGLCSSAVILGFACVKEVNDPETAGISTSIVNTGGFLGAAILPPLMGMVIDAHSNQISSGLVYQKAFVLCFLFSACGFLFSFFIKETGCKNIHKDLESRIIPANPEFMALDQNK